VLLISHCQAKSSKVFIRREGEEILNEGKANVILSPKIIYITFLGKQGRAEVGILSFHPIREPDPRGKDRDIGGGQRISADRVLG
jgi:hypothetical protein